MAHPSRIHEKGTFSLDELLNSVRKNEHFSKTGAIGLFIGIARGEDNERPKSAETYAPSL